MKFDRIKFWYHCSFSGETKNIVWFYCDEGHPGEGDWTGPFKSFTQCKNDAVAFHKQDIESSRRAIKSVNNIKYSEVK